MFASLILINLLASPLIRILQIIPQFGAALGSFSRLEDFFEREEGPQRASHPPGTSHRGHTFTTRRVDQNCGSDNQAIDFSGKSDQSLISIREGDFGWQAASILKDVNLEVSRGEHIAVMGAVGCGKSLLLHAILGELEPKAGHVDVKGCPSFGYCGQIPWLENITARANALRGTNKNEPWDEEVVKACALQSLLDSQMPGETVGSGGSKISGGERQRLVWISTWKQYTISIEAKHSILITF
jgi:ATP-binding cassette subfamily C (CFTR/MRP) protein 1